jgi:hypothetical protein
VYKGFRNLAAVTFQIIAGRRIKRKQSRPESYKVAGREGWHSRERKPEKSEQE